MTSSRSWPPPTDAANTIHFLGDLHFGSVSATRTNKVLADIQNVKAVPVPLAHVQIGDATEDGTSGEDTTALAWLNQLNAPWWTVCGNHDIYLNVRTPAQHATAYGLPAANYTKDIGAVRLIFLAPDSLSGDNTTITLSSTTVTYLDTQLGATSKDCWIVCHAPLLNTVVGDTALVYSSAETAFHVADDTAIRAVLAARTNAKAWISGHTHSPIDASGFLKNETVGSRSIAAINCSAIYYTGRTVEWNDPLCSLYLTKLPGGIEVRVRNHGAGVWDSIAGQRVTTLLTS